MSMDYLRPSSTPYAKRRRANRTLTPLLNSKCGEIFVTPDWNVWTYNCTFCPLNTSDIGVFICHIRLQHSYFESKTNESRRSYSSKQHHQQQQEEEVEQEEEEEHSNIQNDTDETDSNTESRSSIQNIITKEDEIVHPIEFISHSNLMSEEAEDLLHQHHNSLETLIEKTNVTSVKDHSDTNCTNFTKIINLETLIVRNCDGTVAKKEKVNGNKLKKLHEKKSNTSAAPLNTNTVREYLKSGTFKVKTYLGRSRIWDLFGQIVNNDGDKLQNLVACTKCLSVFKHDGKTTSNLWRHKCVKDIEYI